MARVGGDVFNRGNIGYRRNKKRDFYQSHSQSAYTHNASQWFFYFTTLLFNSWNRAHIHILFTWVPISQLLSPISSYFMAFIRYHRGKWMANPKHPSFLPIFSIRPNGKTVFYLVGMFFHSLFFGVCYAHLVYAIDFRDGMGVEMLHLTKYCHTFEYNIEMVVLYETTRISHMLCTILKRLLHPLIP